MKHIAFGKFQGEVCIATMEHLLLALVGDLLDLVCNFLGFMQPPQHNALSLMFGCQTMPNLKPLDGCCPWGNESFCICSFWEGREGSKNMPGNLWIRFSITPGSLVWNYYQIKKQVCSLIFKGTSRLILVFGFQQLPSVAGYVLEHYSDAIEWRA